MLITQDFFAHSVLSFSICILFTLPSCCWPPLQEKKLKSRLYCRHPWNSLPCWEASSTTCAFTYPKLALSLLLPSHPRRCHQAAAMGWHTRTAIGSASRPEPFLHSQLREEKNTGWYERCSPLWVSSNEAIARAIEMTTGSLGMSYSTAKITFQF